MNTVRGVITFPNKNKVFRLVEQGIGTFDIDLAGGEWLIGIDQSTSCTGLCLERASGDIRILLDIVRDKNLESRVFYRDLFKILKKLAKNQKFRYIVMEKPAPKAMYASRVLQELKGRLEEWIDFIPEFEGVPIEALYPQTWKSFVVDKTKGKNRHRDKMAVAEDLCDKIPLIEHYLVEYRGSSFDSFDACGILYGYRKYAFDEEGNEQIHGTIEKTHVAVAGYRWAPVDKITPEGLGMKVWFEVNEPKVLTYNEKYSLRENVRMSSSAHRAVVTVLPRSCLERFMWEYNIDIDDKGMAMVMFVLRKGEFSNHQLQLFKSKVPWNEEVLND